MRIKVFFIFFLIVEFCKAENAISKLEDKMRFASKRHEILSRNIANLNTPGFKSQDLKTQKASFDKNYISLRKTSHKHLDIGGQRMNKFKTKYDKKGIEKKPNNNNVSLQSQTIKINENSKEYETSLLAYKNSIDLLQKSISGGN